VTVALTAMDNQASLALMKFLADLAKRLGVSRHVYVVGGAVRNFVIKKPIKDIDVVIDSVALKGKDSMWFAKEVARAIPTRTNIATNQYGVALLHIVGDWMLGEANLKGEDVEIANARTESYTDGGYTPDTVEKSTIEQDVGRREFTFNTLLWRLHDLAAGPDKAEIIDLTGCGLRDLEEGVMRCPSSPDKTFTDDPSRMIRAIKFLVKYGFTISTEVKRSIVKNKAKVKNIPPGHLSNMLINTFLREPTGKKALIEMEKLGLLDVIKEIAQKDKSFRDALGNWADREAKVEFIFDLMDMGLPSGRSLKFLDAYQLARVREVTVGLSSDAAHQYVAVLRQPGKSMDTRTLMQEFDLKGPQVRQVAEYARRHLLSDPALSTDSRRLTQRVRDDLKGGKTAGEYTEFLRMQAKDKIPGGVGDKAKPGDVDPKQLAKGIKVEMEHTKDREVAEEIALDHLSEPGNEHYYDDLETIEKHGKKFELNIGDPLFTGKYLNSPGRIESFGQNGKGDPTVTVRKRPKKDQGGQGAKKEVKVFKVRFDEEQAKRDKAEKRAGLQETPVYGRSKAALPRGFDGPDPQEEIWGAVLDRVARRFVAAQVRVAARAAPGSKGQKSIKQGRFIVWYLPRYADMVPVVLDGLKRTESAYSRAKYRLPDNIPVLMAARAFGSRRSIYSPMNGGFIQLVPSAFDTKANFATFVHELAHYVHAHQIPGGFRNRTIAEMYATVSRAADQEPVGVPQDAVDQAQVSLDQIDKLWGNVAKMFRKGQRFTIKHRPWKGPEFERGVVVREKKGRGRNTKIVVAFDAPTPEEEQLGILGTSFNVVHADRYLVRPEQVGPKLAEGIPALKKWETEAHEAYNKAVVEQTKTPEARYENHLTTWFPTAYSKENSLEWFAELVSARILALSSMDPEVVAWVDAMMRTGHPPKTASEVLGGPIAWETIGGDRFGGTIIEDDSDGWLVACDDGVTRAVSKTAAKFKGKKEVPKAEGTGTTTVYEYSEGQIQHRNREKAKKVEKLRGSLHKLQSAVTKDLKSKDPKTRLCALAVGLMNDTYERVGNDASAKDGHVGVTGWKPEHVKFSGNKATFTYVGKSGVSQKKTTSDAGLVAGLKEAVKGKGKGDTLFSYEGGRVDAGAVNSYLKPHGITAKDIRGLHANREVQTRLKAIRGKGGKLPSDDKERKTKLKKEFEQAVAEAASEVGHEASTLRSQYLVPGIEDNFLRDGTVKENLAKQGGRTAIIHINNATDGDEGGDLRADAGLISSLTLYEQAVVQDMEIHDVPLVKSGKGYKLRGHLIEPDAVTELVASGYLDEQGGKVVLSDRFKAKQRLYRAAGWMTRRATFRGALKKFIERADEAIAVFEWGQSDVAPDRKDPADSVGGGALGYVFRLNNQWFSMAVDEMSPKRVRSDRAGIGGLRNQWKTAPKVLHRAKKTDGQKEEAEVERLNRRNPSKKPPRKDLRRDRMNVDDGDIEGTGAGGDKDLSLNYKKIAASPAARRVATRYIRTLVARKPREQRKHYKPPTPKPPKAKKPPKLKPLPKKEEPEHKPGGPPWKTDEGKWMAINPEGVSHPFGDGEGAEEKATAYAKGETLDDDAPDAAPEDEPTPKGDAAPEDEPAEDAEPEDEPPEDEKPPEDTAAEAKAKSEQKQFQGDVDQLIRSLRLPRDEAKLLKGMSKDPELFKAYSDDLKAKRDELLEHGVSVEMMREGAKDPFKGLDTSDPLAVAAAIVQVKVNDAVLLNPSMIDGKPLSSEPLNSEARKDRAMASMKQFRRASPEQRVKAAKMAVEQLAKLDPDSPQAAELNSIIDGIQAAAIMNEEDFNVQGADGKLLRKPLSPKGGMLLRHMVQQGNAGVLFMDDSTKVYQAEGRAAVRDAMGTMEDDMLIEMSQGTPWESLGKALKDGKGKLDPEVQEFLRSMMRDMAVNGMTTVQGVAAAITGTDADPATQGDAIKAAREAADKVIAGEMEGGMDSFMADCMSSGEDVKACMADGRETVIRSQIAGAGKAMDESGAEIDPQNVPAAVVRAINNGGDLKLLDDKTLRPEKPFAERVQAWVENVTDPDEKKRIMEMTPEEFAVLEKTVGGTGAAA
jgi:tRNA nucleotidyltransferase/poly(A) polymerase/DNA topoisomerase IB